MSRGIYICANDRAIDQSIALLNSIKLHDQQTPIVLIPYNEPYDKIAQLLADSYGVSVYQNLEMIDRLLNHLFEAFGKDFFARHDQFRKMAAWFGEFDEFLYIDTDIVVFEKIIDNLKYFQDYDFLSCDYQHKAGISNVFAPAILEDKVFNDSELQDMFNGGFFASKKNALTEQDIYEIFSECAVHINYFDFSQKTSDQPILNYLILKKIKRRFNIVRQSPHEPGSWARTPHFIETDNYTLVDSKSNQPLKYLHWAGIRIQPECPYWDIWQHYRYLHSPETGEILPTPQPTQNAFIKNLKKMFQKVKSKI